MTRPTTSADLRTSVADIEDALDALLTAIIEHDRARTAPPGGISATPWRIWHAAELMKCDRHDLDLDGLVRQPIGCGLKSAVRQLGEHLFRIGGATDGMREVAERVADRDPAHWGRRASILDSAWNGIGSGSDRWWS